MPNGHFEAIAEIIEQRILTQGLDNVDVKDLMILQVHQMSRLEEKLGQPFWAHWTPKQMATAILAVLAAVGLISAPSLTNALGLLGG